MRMLKNKEIQLENLLFTALRLKLLCDSARNCSINENGSFKTWLFHATFPLYVIIYNRNNNAFHTIIVQKSNNIAFKLIPVI